MSYRESRSNWSVAGAFGLAFVAAGCSPDSQAGEIDAANGDAFAKVVNVEVLEMQPEEFTTYVRILAEVEAQNDVTVSAEESGVVQTFYIEKGSTVKRGQSIAKIDDLLLRAQVDEANAAAQLAHWRYERQRQLWEDEQIGSELAYQESKHNADLAAARLANLERRLARTVIRAPFGGIFDSKFVEAGERVDPGTPVARFVQVNRLKITGGVPERYAPAVQPGDQAVINFEVFPDRTFTGQIGYVGTAVDTRNRTFPIEVVLDNPERLIKPQMIASVEIATDHFDSALVLPQSAVMRVEDGYQVYVVTDEDGGLYARARLVKVGGSYANRTMIREGLETGERVVVRGQQLVESGDRVRIVNQAAIEAE